MNEVFMRFLEGMVTGGNSGRATALTDKIGDNIIVDTCYCDDTQAWETGVERDGEKWVIVATYKDCEKEATNGHAHWVGKLTTNPSLTLVEVQGPEVLWG